MKRIILSVIFACFVLYGCIPVNAMRSNMSIDEFVDFIGNEFTKNFGKNTSMELSSELKNVIDARLWDSSYADVNNYYTSNEQIRNAYDSQKSNMIELNNTLYNALKAIAPDYNLLFTIRANEKNDEVIVAFYDGKCIYDKAQKIFLSEEYGDILENIEIDSEYKHIISLEKRIAALEAVVYGKNVTGSFTENITDEPLILSGLYIVGEDIESGSYSFKVLDGNSVGEIAIFATYDSYVEYSGNKLLSIYFEDLRSPDYDAFADNKEWNDYYDSYVTSISNLVLRNKMCVSITGVQVEATKK